MAMKQEPGSSAPQDTTSSWVSADLVQHEKFLHDFVPTGSTDVELRTSLAGVGQSELADRAIEAGGTLVELALGIVCNHRNEMDRIDRGERTRWGDYQCWDPVQRQLYRLMEMEEVILMSIVTRVHLAGSHTGRRSGS
jgi:hypothetical protein